MRDFIATLAAQHRQSFLEHLTGVFRRRRDRQRFLEVTNLDDDQLRDIGLCRADVAYLRGLPADVDLTFEADRLRYHASYRRLQSPK